MWKLLAGFLVLSAVFIFLLMKGGDIDMSGEKHGIEAPAAEAAKK